MSFSTILNTVCHGRTLSTQEAEQAFSLIMNGDAEPVQISAFLTALKVRGETVDEITGGVLALRARANKIHASGTLVDTCGTGGDGLNTYNVSTAAALVCAAAGVKVAKHGNRSVSSKSGSADVLEALGATLELPAPLQEECLEKVGFSFLFAPKHHRAMKHAAEVRKKLKIRTIFNLLGPLANPAGAKHQLIGVYDKKWVRPMAEVLKKLGSTHVLVVHGMDGMDEISISGPTLVAELKEGAITEYSISPESVHLSCSAIEDIKGGDAQKNAAALSDLMDGKPSAYRDITVFNAGAALYVSGMASTLLDGVKQASNAIDTGFAAHTLKQWIAFTNEANTPGQEA